jgi:transposase
MPKAVGRSRPWRDHRQVVEGIVFRYRTGVAWRDLLGRFGPWQTVWKRHHRFATDGTWDKLLRMIQAEADAAGRVDWNVSVDSSICERTSIRLRPSAVPGTIALCSSSTQRRCRMTRIRAAAGTNRAITPSAARAAG